MSTSAERVRRYRERKKALQSGGVTPKDVTDVTEMDVTPKVTPSFKSRLPWPYNKGKPPRWGAGVPQYIPLTSEEQTAMGQWLDQERKRLQRERRNEQRRKAA